MQSVAEARAAKASRSRRRSITEEGDVAELAAVAPAPQESGQRKGKRKKKNSCKRTVRAFGQRLSAVLNGSSLVLGKALSGLSVTAALLLGCVAIVAALQQRSAAAQEVLASILSCGFTGVGVAGAKMQDRGVLMLYFVLVAWSVASFTSSISTMIVERVQQQALCDHPSTENDGDETLGASAVRGASRLVLYRVASQPLDLPRTNLTSSLGAVPSFSLCCSFLSKA
eukprot:SAG22_NODE_1571_length_4095_cov_2.849099_1_plen_227_part_00